MGPLKHAQRSKARWGSSSLSCTQASKISPAALSDTRSKPQPPLAEFAYTVESCALRYITQMSDFFFLTGCCKQVVKYETPQPEGVKASIHAVSRGSYETRRPFWQRQGARILDVGHTWALVGSPRVRVHNTHGST
jgi:hypothetical protein